jgi:hypothetical protein
VTEHEHESPAAKLARLLETLDPNDRQELVAWLLGGEAGPGVAWPNVSHFGMPVRSRRVEIGVGVGEASGLPALLRGVATGEANQLVTVRLPTEQHERLRTWCTEHSFTMAAVIRGLIERFLDQQGSAAAA